MRFEGLHTAEFLVSESKLYRSREVGTLKAGQSVKAGEVLAMDGTDLVALPGILDSGLALDTPVVGIAYAAGGGTAATPNFVYIARDAEVSDARLTYPDETSPGGERAATIASLAALGIIVRMGNEVPT